MESSKQFQRYHSLWAITGMMVLYIMSARIGMLLAVGDSNVTILWPPSGIALAAVVLVGPRVLPGIWLGYVVGNSWWLLDKPDVSPGNAMPYILNAFIVTAQAQVGAVLLKRFAKPFEEVRTLRDVLEYLVLGGPLSCLVAGLCGPATLVAFGEIPSAAYRDVATTWWLGDTMGVLFLVPLILGFAGQGENRFNPWLYIASTVLMILGAMVLFGWYSANPDFARLHPAFDVMDFKTALAFFLAGLGVVCLSAGSFRAARASGLVLIVLSIVSLSQHIVHWTMPGDGVFSHLESGATGDTHHMAPNAGICFLIVGFGLFVLASKSYRAFTMFASVSGATIMTLGLVSYLGYLSDIPMAFTWGALTRMSVHTALGVIVLGTIFVVLGARYGTSYADQQMRVSIPLGLFLLMMTLTISQALMSDARRRTDARIQDRLVEYERVIQFELERRVRALERMAERWEASGGTDRKTWTRDAWNYLADYEDFQALEWTDTNYIIQWVEPEIDNEAAVGLNLNDPHPSFPLLEKAKETGEIQTTKVINLAQGGKGFVIYCPIGAGEKNDGFIVGVFRLQRFFSKLVEPLTDQFKISVYEDGDAIFTSNDPDAAIAPDHPTRTILDMGLSNNWVTVISPLQSYLDEQRSVVPILVFLGGLTLSVLMPTCVYLFYGALHQIEQVNSARAELASSEERFRAIAENSNDVVWTMDSNFNYTYVSPAIEEFRGVTPEIAMTQSVEQYMTPESCDKVRNEYAAAMRRWAEHPESAQEQVSIELEMFHADGHRIYGEIRPSLLRNADGSIAGIQGTTRNITERKEAGLRREALLRLALEPTLYTGGLAAAARMITSVSARALHCERVGLWLLSDDGNTLKNVNMYCMSEDRHDASAPLLMDDFPKYKTALYQEHVLAVDDVRTSDAVSDLLATYCNPLGITSMLDGVVRVGGQVRGVVCHENVGPKRVWSASDIEFVAEIAAQIAHVINHAQLTQERNRARELALKADAANRAKKLFLSNLSHEIRTPMNVIMGYAEDLSRDDTLREEQNEAVQRMYASARHLLGLLNSLIEVSRLDTGQVASVEAEVDLRSICGDVARAHQDTCTAKGLDLHVELSQNLPSTVRTDESKVVQILTNLLDNAVKYTDSGHVKLQLECGEPEVSSLPIVISVSDTGAGIDPSDVDYIFDPFARLDERPGLGQGTGLGLSICREYAHALEGDLTVESAPGAGSTFRLRFPVDFQIEDAPLAREIAVLQIPALRRSRVLIADPSRDVSTLLADLMVHAGMDVKLVTSGDDIVTCCSEWHPNVVWMASSLGDSNATEVLVHLREDESLNGLKICLTTEAAAPEGAGVPKESLADVVLTKPFTASRVYTILEAFVGVDADSSESGGGLAESQYTVWDHLGEIAPESLDSIGEALRAIDMARIRAELVALEASHSLLAREMRRRIDLFEFEEVLSRIETVRGSAK